MTGRNESQLRRRSTIRAEGLKSGNTRRSRLLVIGPDTFDTHHLPAAGTLTIGRSAECTVQIDDPWVSRQHLKLHIGPTMRVEELGSANGTLVREAPLPSGETAEVLPGDVITLGEWMLILEYQASTARPRRLWPHGYFEARLESECARAERSGASLAVARLTVGQDVPVPQVLEALSSTLRSDEIVASYGPGEFELLLTDTDTDTAEERVQVICKSLEVYGLVPKSGIASYPKHGRSPEELIATACAEVRGVQPGELSSSIIIKDSAMTRLHQLVARVATGSISVMLLGETGVGKEVVAETIHRRSPRGECPFLRLNCAALTETLLESELFGHVKGAFTGAVADKLGLLESAHTGTVFLDEVGEMPLSAQAKLLRVIEERKVLRVGGLQPRSIDVRFVSATNRDLELEIEQGRFRQDLYFRLNGISLRIPPLRERTSEIESLARLFVTEVCKQDSRPEPRISEGALNALRAYSFPGNIRELRNIMERAVLLCLGDEITPDQLQLQSMTTIPAPEPEPQIEAAPESDQDDEDTDLELKGEGLQKELQAFERKRILDALHACGGNQTRAAKMLGISRRTLVQRIKTYEIPRPLKR